MEMTPLLDIALGVFLLIFGPLVISAGQKDVSREGQWQVAALAVCLLVAIPAAAVSGWVYVLEQNPQFLMQTLISLVVVVGCILSIWRLTRTWNTPMRQNLIFLSDLLLSTTGGLMGLSGLLIVLTYPILALTADASVIQMRNIVHIFGAGAGFSAIALMLLNLIVAEN